ncbi:protein norD [Rhodopseudomonas sp. AAP120]|uniref:nitric oxide reductase activation protein NorD n=1 Tax=Rhodopseudomonas sp. AAP120 TaxID=1523430 RepID=UPI0006B9A505|nr:VWA domain-containing protein [Rhodopseudomonas sp. AAP120]KPG01451.1 protein norD [Rhodopseudomonas sp. AAP120]
MLDILELEETVGRAWHRMVGRAASYPDYPEAAALLSNERTALGVMYRGLGGEVGVQIAPAGARTSGHSLGWKQRIGLGEERLAQPVRDEATLFLPERIALFADAALNRALYRWLAAWFAVASDGAISESDPLRRDLFTLRRAERTTRAVLAKFPGLAAAHAKLGGALARARPRRSLSRSERDIETLILALLGADARPDPALWRIIVGDADLPPKAPPGYQTFLPCPLWGEVWARSEGAARGEADEPSDVASRQTSQARRKSAKRKSNDGPQRDPLALNRFEKILAMAEMVDVDRPTDEDDDEHADKAADDLDEITLGKSSKKPSSKFRFDLDLPPQAVEAGRLSTGKLYPEWDYKRGAYLPDHCRVHAAPASATGEAWQCSEATRALIKRVKRQFETLRPRHELLRAQPEGHDLDLDALVRARCDLSAGRAGSERLHLAARPQARDLAVTLLVDVSLSTDAWIDNRRVLDVEKEALTVLAHGLSACGDAHSILTFTSRRRDWVRVETVKAFGEPMGALVEQRIAALRPGYYTRIGAALRHATAELAAQPQHKKLVLLLTDGKPNDIDHYEGRFALEDSRKAVQEARRSSVAVFGVTIDVDAQDYFAPLFGRAGYAIVGQVERLPSALPRIYQHLMR